MDMDTELRLGMIRDAVELKKAAGRCDGVLVTGDIAYNGDAAQYELAIGWLSDLCAAVGCGPEEVWCVPGNHDIQRTESGGNRETIIQQWRSGDPAGLSDSVIKCLRDPSSEDVWFRCLANYNAFARRFSCEISSKSAWWEEPSSPTLNDGSVLRIRGVTSVLASNSTDHREKARLVLGEIQLHRERKPGEAVLLLCHHPPDWLRDDETVEPALKAYADVQLYGHKHVHAFREVDGRIRVHAGALQPARDEGKWCPRFNFMELAVRTERGDRYLDVTVQSRIWDTAERAFKADGAVGGGPHRGSVKLAAWEPTSMATNNATMPAPVNSGPGHAAPITGTVPPAHNPHKVLTYRFFGLSFTVRLQIAQELGLIEDADEQLTERERWQAVFERARAKRRLNDMWQSVRQRSGAMDMVGDPFTGQ